MLERIRKLLIGPRALPVVPWPQPADDWEEDETPVRIFDCTDEDPGPERIIPCELRPLVA